MYNNEILINLVNKLLSKKCEGNYWDFKQEWHNDKNKLIKDILCFTNTIHNKDCYLIFGVDDNFSVVGMKNTRTKEAEIRDKLYGMEFAGDIIPKISLYTINYNYVELDILIVHNIDNTPVYLKKSYGKVIYQGLIYARDGDRNTNAEMKFIENLWKKRLGLLKPPLEYILSNLRKKEDWQEWTRGYYYIYKPEYTLEYDEELVREGEQFYSYTQTNESTFFKTLNIKSNGRILDEIEIVVLDSGRLEIPTPKWSFIYKDEYRQNCIAYKYYIFSENNYKILKFLYNPECQEQRDSFEDFSEVVLFYKSTEEKEEFEEYARCNLELISNLIEKNKDKYGRISDIESHKIKSYTEKLVESYSLKEMFREYKKNR